MVNAAPLAAGFVDLCAGIMALEIFYFLDPQFSASTTPPAEAPMLDSALELLLPLAAVWALLAAVAVIYHHLVCTCAAVHAAGGGAASRRLSELIAFAICVSAGVLDYFFFVRPTGGVDRGAQARALGLAAHRALPTAATATFFWGMMLIIVAHIRAGGEGGGGAVAGAGHGAIQGPVRLLTKIAVGAAAGLVFLVTVALCFKY